MCFIALIGSLALVWGWGFLNHAFARFDVITDNDSKIVELQEHMKQGFPSAASDRQELIEENRQLRAHEWDPLWFLHASTPSS